MKSQDTDPDEIGSTWEQVLRDREYPEHVIMELKAKREAKRELHFEDGEESDS